MKNIHILTTGQPSRLLRGIEGIRLFENEVSPDNEWCVNVNIHITNDEEIKDGDKRINNYQRKPKGEEIPSKKIILTTDQDLIKDGVQAIDNDFLEWFVKNPSCEEVEVKMNEGRYVDYGGNVHITNAYKIIIPKEETKKMKVMIVGSGLPKQETLEEAAKKYFNYNIFGDCITDFEKEISLRSYIAGAKWQQEQDKNKYSEEEMLEFSEWVSHNDWVYLPSKGYWVNEEVEESEEKFTTKELFKQFKNK
jgi:hypothetical protein